MISIDVKGMTVDKFDKFVKAVAPEIIKDAARVSMNRISKSVQSRASKSISNAADIRPQKLIKQRMSMFKATKKRLRTGVTFRSGPMPAETVAGKSGVKWNKKMEGASVKGKVYPGTFGATPHKGKHAEKRKRIYRRVAKTGSNRSDLRAQYIHIEKYGSILTKVGARVVSQKLEKEFVSQFEYRMRKSGFVL